MIRYLTTLACCLLTASVFSNEEEEPREDLFLSTPEQVATLTSEPSYLVGGLISPLSGQPALRQTDLIVKGAQNIILSRTYLPPYMPCSFPHHKHYQEEHDKKYLYCHLRDNYKGWQFYPHLKLEFIPRLMEVRLSEPSGMTLDFRLSGPGLSKTSLASHPYAISNVAGDVPSGKYDPRNTRISYEENGNKITVHAWMEQLGITVKKAWQQELLIYISLKKKFSRMERSLSIIITREISFITSKALIPKRDMSTLRFALQECRGMVIAILPLRPA